jgi:hypothetical protein
MQYLFAMALKAKMPRLDDACMHWPNGDLVNLFALDPVKIHDPNAGLPLGLLALTIGIRSACSNEADRLRPRVAFGNDAPLFRDFALE